jgi:hypothetical protein
VIGEGVSAAVCHQEFSFRPYGDPFSTLKCRLLHCHLCRRVFILCRSEIPFVDAYETLILHNLVRPIDGGRGF